MNRKPLDIEIAPNGMLHIRKGRLTLFCGSIELARVLYAALGKFLTDRAA